MNQQRTWGLFAAVGALLAWGWVAGAQSHPDFSGAWVVESVEAPARGQGDAGGAGGAGRRSGRGGGGADGGRGGFAGERGGQGRGSAERGAGQGGPVGPAFRVGDAVQIKQTADQLFVTRERDGGGVMTSYALDGSESRNEEPDGTMSMSKTRWEGEALVTTGSVSVSNMRGDMTIKTRAVRSVSGDGGTMTLALTADTPRGKRTTTVRFARQGR